MGDLQSEEERDILLELKMQAITADASEQAIKGQLVYFNVVTSGIDTVECNLTIERNSKCSLK